MKIRGYRDSDRKQVEKICRITGKSSGPLAMLFDKALLPVFCNYYLDNEPDNCFVAVDDEDIAVGYILCAENFEKWAKVFEENYIKTSKNPVVPAMGAACIESLGTVKDDYPAHLHIDILPEYQAKGIGGQLITALEDHLADKGIFGLALDVAADNENGKKFYKKMNYEVLHEGKESTLMGKIIPDIWNPDAPKVDMTKKRIACIGDSITFGHGVFKTIATESYPAVLNSLLSKDYQVLNYGLSGRTLLKDGDMPYIIEDFYKKSLEANADIYIIMLGTNDSKPFNWEKGNYEEELESFVNSYLKLDSKPVIYLMIPPNCFPVGENNEVPYDMDIDRLTGDIASAIRNVSAKLNVNVIDLYTFTLNHPDWFMDGIHPNAIGNKNIAEEIYKKVI